MKIAIVIPTHNRKNSLIECLKYVYESDYKNIDVIVIDDGSNDGTSEEISVNFPSVRILHGDGSLWWTGSMNLGVRDALARGADYVLALNDDVLIAPNAVKALVDCASAHPGAVVGSLIYEAGRPDTIWCAGGVLAWPWPGEVMLGHNQQDMGQYDGVRAVRWTPGMGTLMSREVLLKLNLYDARNMPHYIADADFTLRASQAGYPILVTSESKLYNHVENTGGIPADRRRITWHEFVSIFTSLRSPEYLRARLVFIWRHCPKGWLIAAFLIRYSRMLVYGLKRIAL